VEQYELPLDVSEISIVEEEPEISWIKRFSVIATDTAGHVRDLATSEGPFYLEFGQTKALSVPPALPGEKVAVSVDGYFIPYSMLIGSHVKRSAADPG
jgi:hypothetical protein